LRIGLRRRPREVESLQSYLEKRARELPEEPEAVDVAVGEAETSNGYPPGTSAADQHDVALLGEEGAASEGLPPGGAFSPVGPDAGAERTRHGASYGQREATYGRASWRGRGGRMSDWYDCHVCGMAHPWPVPEKPCPHFGTTDQHVYVLSIPGGYYKIGRTINIKARVADLQCGCPERIKVEGGPPIIAGGVSAAAMEADVHRRLASYRTSGEWVRVPEDELAMAWRKAWFTLSQPDGYRDPERVMRAASGGAPSC
jgi:hypothetical protein